MTKKLDPDVRVLNQVIRALDKSTSRRMLKANIDFIIDKYITHPAQRMPEHLKKGYLDK